MCKTRRTFADRERHCDDTVGALHAVETADEVGQIVKHTEIVLHHNHVAARRRGKVNGVSERKRNGIGRRRGERDRRKTKPRIANARKE